MNYARDVAALARKDLLLELRAKETLPSMLLFVLAALTIFHFALPHGASHQAALGLLWAALIFTALLGLTRAFVAEREQGMFDALVLAPCDRSAIWLGKTLAVLSFLVAAEVVALPAFAAFFSGIDGRTVAAVALANIGIATVGTLFGAMAVAGRARELLLPLALPADGDPDRGRRRGAVPVVPPALRRDLRGAQLGRVRVRRVGDLASDYDADAVKTHLRLPALALVSTGLTGLALGLVFFYAPTDADQGFSQRIFYFHVPIALTSYVCFGWGAWKALRYLRTRDERADLESYVAIHQGVIFGALTLVTGSIWAKASWGVWWSWSENQLVLFLVLFLFYCAYFMLRFSVEAGAARANMSAVYALFGVVLIPVSFLAIRLSQKFIHPVVFNSHGPQMAGSQFFVFCVSFAAVLALFATLYQVELAGKRLDAHVRELRELLT